LIITFTVRPIINSFTPYSKEASVDAYISPLLHTRINLKQLNFIVSSYSSTRPGNSAILLTIPDALRATEKDVNIAQYRAFTIPDALRVPEKKFPLILVRGSQSYLSWLISWLYLCPRTSLTHVGLYAQTLHTLAHIYTRTHTHTHFWYNSLNVV